LELIWMFEPKSEKDAVGSHPMGRILAIAVSAVSLATTALAQQSSQVDSQTLQQTNAFVQKFDQALSNGDHAALSSFYMPGALVITPFGKLKDAKTDFHAADRLHSMGGRETSQVEDVQPVFNGQGLLVTAAYTLTFAPDRNIPTAHGYYLFVLEKTGDEWKIRASSASRLVPSAPPK
jgi:ketosteroid isomerase-like protein